MIHAWVRPGGRINVVPMQPGQLFSPGADGALPESRHPKIVNGGIIQFGCSYGCRPASAGTEAAEPGFPDDRYGSSSMQDGRRC